nr:MAG TPA: hypothetical protein [Inoviridae sp.]DAW96762.1 MAG TPA: hypothetical protein [Inoviridae sp.]
MIFSSKDCKHFFIKLFSEDSYKKYNICPRRTSQSKS